MVSRESDESSTPPPLPGQPGLQRPGFKNDAPLRESSLKRKWHWPTVIFATLPATLLAFPAAVAILLGFTFALGLQPAAFVMLICGVLSWVGMISLWFAARSSGFVTKRTAWGLAGGIVGVLIYFGIEIFGNEQDSRLWPFTPVLTIGPLLFAISYLLRYRKRKRQADIELDGDPIAIRGANAAAQDEPYPFDEVRMRKVLTLLLIISAIIELVTVPPVLNMPPGLGHVAVIVFSFPFFLGIAVTAIWCFWRSKALRGLAAAALLTPILLPLGLHWATKWFGQEVTTQIAFITAIAVPILIFLVMPKRVAGYLPRFAVDSRWFNAAWTGLLAVMLIPWAILAIGFRSFKETGSSSEFSFLVWYAGASIIVAVITIFMAYIGLRAQQRQQTGLRITQIGLSFLLLLIATPVVVVILFIFGLAGLG